MNIQFLGATHEVTGSCFLIEANGQRVLVDCGSIQGSYRNESRNYNKFDFDPALLDAMVLTHAHIDHSGRIPLLIKRGFKGKIFTHEATRDLCEILLRDSGYLYEKDAEIETRKRLRAGGNPVEPLYTVDDAIAALPSFSGMAYHKAKEILPGVKVTLHDAGHIIGSAIVEIQLSEKGTQRTVVFSGDLGHSNAPILRDPEYIKSADLVVMESTYGNRCHRPWQATWDELRDVIKTAHKDKGNILIPAFAVGRTQELLYMFHRHYKDWGIDQWKIYLDSPMAINATTAYSKHWDLYDKEALSLVKKEGSPYRLPNLWLSQSAKDSMELNLIKHGAIFVAGSGMCSGGRIKHHLKFNLWRPECHIIIVGFQAQGTLGRILVDGAKKVHLWGETIKVAAKIHTIGGLSAHADQKGLIDWYQHFENNPKLVLVHGEEKTMTILRDEIHTKCGVQAVMPNAGEVIEL